MTVPQKEDQEEEERKKNHVVNLLASRFFFPCVHSIPELTNGEYAIVLIMAALVMVVVIMAVLPQSQRMNPELSPN